MEITKESSASPEELLRRSKMPQEPPDGPPDPTGPEPAIGFAEALGEHVANPPEARTEGNKLFLPDGTALVVPGCEARIKGQMELWVQNNALKAIAEMDESGNGARADNMANHYADEKSIGSYSWNGKFVIQAVTTSFPGQTHLLYLLLKRGGSSLTEEQVADLMFKHPKQCGRLVVWALGNSQPPASTGANGTATARNVLLKTPTLD